MSCNIISGRPSVVGILIAPNGADLVATQVFQHLSDPNEDQALQLLSLQNALAASLPDVAADAAVVRSPDWSQFTKRAVLRKKYAVEGVLLATCRNRLRQVRSMDGREIGEIMGSNKAEIEARARVLANEAVEACAAALAAAEIARQGGI